MATALSPMSSVENNLRCCCPSNHRTRWGFFINGSGKTTMQSRLSTYFRQSQPLLPHYNDLRPDSGRLQEDNVISWRYTEARLLQLLRTAAEQAEEDGDITAEQKHQFFKSVTEHEIEEGLRTPNGDESEPSAVLFVRVLPHLHKKDSPKQLAQNMDVTADGLLDTEAQDFFSGLKSPRRASSTCTVGWCSEDEGDRRRCRAGEGQGDGEVGGEGEGEEDRGWLLQELSHHMALRARKGLAVFRGPEGLLGKICLAMWEHTNVRHAPLVVQVLPGVGKTALLCKLAQEVRGLLDPRAVLVLRFLGTSAESSDVDRVLRSVCFQICAAFSLLPLPPLTAHVHEDLVRFFHGLLAEVSERGHTLLIILDALDQLSYATHSQKLHWLPKDIPCNGKEIMDVYMREAQRSLTPEQCEVAMHSFQLSGNPLHLKLVLDMARRRESYTSVTGLSLSSSAQEIMHNLGEPLMEGQANGIMVLDFHRRLLTETVRERHLRSEQRAERHRVPPQPLWFAKGVANVKKLQELPYHLLNAGLWDELHQEVIGKAKGHMQQAEVSGCTVSLTCGVASVIEDLTLCIELMDSPETQLIRDTFIHSPQVHPGLPRWTDGLHSFAEMYSSLIGQLCSHCHDWLLCFTDPILVPKCTFPQSPGGALKTTLAGSEEGKVIAWDLSDLEVIQTLVGHTGSSTDTMAISAEVCCLELAQHKRLLFCGLKTGTVLIYPLAFPQETVCIPPPETLPIGGQEKCIAVAYEDSVCLFEITAQDSFPCVEGPFERFPLSLLHSPVSSMALLRDCRLLYRTACGEVILYDFKSTSATTLEGHRSRVTCVTDSNWGTHALVGSEDSVQRLWGLTPLVLDHTMEYKLGYVIKEGFCCPDNVSPEYIPLWNVKAQYRVTSREKSADSPHTVITEISEYNPAQFNFMGLMLKTKPSHSCQLL
ncbi:unnamed protein product [Coregonus sp. 'balchen']|nr:unnamed protein product [Coregonus sp. 'balchen']